jgi:hypothetical protein
LNFFFSLSAEGVKAVLHIPKFQNLGTRCGDLKLFEALIVNEKWVVKKPTSVTESEDFHFVMQPNDQSIYFYGRDCAAFKILKENQLLDMEGFTDTQPDFRCNLRIDNLKGGFSSYQSEYPFRMVKSLSSLYSECGLLSQPSASRVGLFIRNIHLNPVTYARKLFLYCDEVDDILDTFVVNLNCCTFIDLTQYKDRLGSCFVYVKDFSGIPIYMTESKNGLISIEHTHPPHEAIRGAEKFHLVQEFKKRVDEKIFQKINKD